MRANHRVPDPGSLLDEIRLESAIKIACNCFPASIDSGTPSIVSRSGEPQGASTPDTQQRTGASPDVVQTPSREQLSLATSRPS